MFLKELSVTEREAFISLSVHAAKANGVIADEEKTFVKEYAQKIGIEDDTVKKITEVVTKYLDVLKEVAEIILQYLCKQYKVIGHKRFMNKRCY